MLRPTTPCECQREVSSASLLQFVFALCQQGKLVSLRTLRDFGEGRGRMELEFRHFPRGLIDREVRPVCLRETMSLLIHKEIVLPTHGYDTRILGGSLGTLE